MKILYIVQNIGKMIEEGRRGKGTRGWGGGKRTLSAQQGGAGNKKRLGTQRLTLVRNRGAPRSGSGFGRCCAKKLRLFLKFLHFRGDARSAGRSASTTCGTATLGCAPKNIGRRNAQMSKTPGKRFAFSADLSPYLLVCTAWKAMPLTRHERGWGGPAATGRAFPRSKRRSRRSSANGPISF